MKALVAFLLSLTGAGFLTTAAFLVSLPAGFAAAGFLLLVTGLVLVDIDKGER